MPGCRGPHYLSRKLPGRECQVVGVHIIYLGSFQVESAWLWDPHYLSRKLPGRECQVVGVHIIYLGSSQVESARL